MGRPHHLCWRGRHREHGRPRRRTTRATAPAPPESATADAALASATSPTPAPAPAALSRLGQRPLSPPLSRRRPPTRSHRRPPAPPRQSREYQARLRLLMEQMAEAEKKGADKKGVSGKARQTSGSSKSSRKGGAAAELRARSSREVAERWPRGGRALAEMRPRSSRRWPSCWCSCSRDLAELQPRSSRDVAEM